ncbi:MAG TPA: ABC transporter substrate-binding protein [Devosiaceae bacterium]|jgi:peptide/nickel transport system substrate-binding protein
MSLNLSRRNFVRLTAAAGASTMLPRFAIAQSRPDIVIAVQQNPNTTEPLNEIGNTGFRGLYSVYDNLIATDYANGMKTKPGLATEWKRIDNRTLELKLRPGVKFHNGDTMTAEDVAFSFGPERMNSKDAPGWAPTRYIWGGLDSVQIVDASTVRFVTKQDDPILEKRVAGWCSQIISKRAYTEAGDWKKWSIIGVGTGPLKVVENKPGEYIRLEAHDDYWGGKPNVASVTFRVVAEVAARIAGLEAGEYQVISDLPPDHFDEVGARSDLGVVGGPLFNHRVVCFDCRNPLIAKPAMRQALSLALDRQSLVDSLWGGKVGVPRGLQWAQYGDLYNAQRAKPAFDLDKTKELLNAAGYGGEQLMYRIANNYYLNEVPTAEAITDMWSAAGINVKLEVVENMHNPDNAAMYDWSNSGLMLDPVGGIWRLYGDTAYQQGNGLWKNDEFNRLGGVLNTSMDQAERYKAEQSMLDIYDTIDPPGFILHEFGAFFGKSNKVDFPFYPDLAMDFGPDAFKIA